MWHVAYDKRHVGVALPQAFQVYFFQGVMHQQSSKVGSIRRGSIPLIISNFKSPRSSLGLSFSTRQHQVMIKWVRNRVTK